MELSRGRFGSTRRELLRSLLGLSFGAGCRRHVPELAFEGGFVDRSAEDAHRLRGGLLPTSPVPGAPRGVRVAIVGGGIAGLSAAWALRRLGIDDLVVLELEDAPGGTARSGRSSFGDHPWGAHYLPTPGRENVELLALLAEAGSVVGGVDDGKDSEPIFEETHLVAAPKERAYFRGTWLEGQFPRAAASTADLEDLRLFGHEVAKLISLRDRDGRRAFTLPMAACGDTAELRALDAMSMAEWLDRKGLHSPLVRWMIELGARDDFGTELADLSAWYGLHYFTSRTRTPGEESADFLTWPGGNGFLVDHLVRRVGEARIEREMLVTEVRPSAEGRRAEVVALARRGARATRWVAERVIFALPSFLRKRILHPELSRGSSFEPETVPWVVSNVFLADRPASDGFGQAWDNIIHGSRSLGYVVATHQRHRDFGPTIWTHYVALSGRDSRAERRALAGLGYRDIADAVVEELDACHTRFRERVRRIDIMRFGHAMVRPSVGTAFSRERARAVTPVGPVHFAHTDLSGMALFEEAFFHGCRAAHEVWRTLA